jgi:hypothetical protein
MMRAGSERAKTRPMTEIHFYHLQRQSLERALPQLVEKCLERGWRCVVQAASDEQGARVERSETRGRSVAYEEIWIALRFIRATLAMSGRAAPPSSRWSVPRPV